MSITVVLDTNSLYADTALRGADAGRLLSMSRRGLIALCLPRVVIDELRRHRRQIVTNQHRILTAMPRKAEDALRLLGVDAERAGIVVPLAPVMNVSDLIDVYDHEVADRLRENGVNILGLPEIDLEAVYQRDLAARPPFESSGKGFRDTLIWAGVIEWCAAVGNDDVVYLVTNDRIFGDGVLDRSLAEEVAADGAQVHLATDIPALLGNPELSERRLRLQRQLDVLDEASNTSTAAERGVRSALEDLDLDWDALRARLSIADDVYDLTLVGADGLRDFSWDVYDEFDETTVLGQAVITAVLLLEGVLVTEPEIEIHQYAESNDLEVEAADAFGTGHVVTARRQVVLYFDVRVETIAGMVDTIDFERLELV